jgi:hypothetical protein
LDEKSPIALIIYDTGALSAERQPDPIFIEPALSTFPRYHYDELRSTERIIVGVSDYVHW